LPDAQAISMAEDADGAIWIAYAGGAVSRIKDGQAKRFGAKEGLPSGDSCALASDAKGNLWFARGGSVGVFHDGNFKTLLTLPEPAICIGQAHGGGIWICAGVRLLKYDAGAEPVMIGQLPKGSERNDPRAMLEDRTGAVWIGTAGSGLFRYNGSKIAQVPVSYPEITSLTEDREGNIWAGTYGGGLNRLRPCAVELLGAETGLLYQSVRSVCEDAGGKIWVATQNGLLARWGGLCGRRYRWKRTGLADTPLAWRRTARVESGLARMIADSTNGRTDSVTSGAGRTVSPATMCVRSY
jgi:ligand-binding sensor domain-containing protein